MYNIHREDQFPEGLFRTKRGRQGILKGAFCDVVVQRNGVAPTEEQFREERRQIRNIDESTYERLPCLAFFHQGLPRVQPDFWYGKYVRADATQIMSRDELGYFAAKEEGFGK